MPHSLYATTDIPLTPHRSPLQEQPTAVSRTELRPGTATDLESIQKAVLPVVSP
ncbi:hypothetical protein PQR15_32300 [Streptomyces lydicus]|nr:hypothetical protein [Streptomyces lydicus]